LKEVLLIYKMQNKIKPYNPARKNGGSYYPTISGEILFNPEIMHGDSPIYIPGVNEKEHWSVIKASEWSEVYQKLVSLEIIKENDIEKYQTAYKETDNIIVIIPGQIIILYIEEEFDLAENEYLICYTDINLLKVNNIKKLINNKWICEIQNNSRELHIPLNLSQKIIQIRITSN
jgi:hypothetical protein